MAKYVTKFSLMICLNLVVPSVAQAQSDNVLTVFKGDLVKCPKEVYTLPRAKLLCAISPFVKGEILFSALKFNGIVIRVFDRSELINYNLSKAKHLVVWTIPKNKNALNCQKIYVGNTIDRDCVVFRN